MILTLVTFAGVIAKWRTCWQSFLDESPCLKKALDALDESTRNQANSFLGQKRYKQLLKQFEVIMDEAAALDLLHRWLPQPQPCAPPPQPPAPSSPPPCSEELDGVGDGGGDNGGLEREHLDDDEGGGEGRGGDGGGGDGDGGGGNGGFDCDGESWNHLFIEDEWAQVPLPAGGFGDCYAVRKHAWNSVRRGVERGFFWNKSFPIALDHCMSGLGMRAEDAFLLDSCRSAGVDIRAWKSIRYRPSNFLSHFHRNECGCLFRPRTTTTSLLGELRALAWLGPSDSPHSLLSGGTGSRPGEDYKRLFFLPAISFIFDSASFVECTIFRGGGCRVLGALWEPTSSLRSHVLRLEASSTKLQCEPETVHREVRLYSTYK